MRSVGHGLGMSSPVLLAAELVVTSPSQVPRQGKVQESLAPGHRGEKRPNTGQVVSLGCLLANAQWRSHRPCYISQDRDKFVGKKGMWWMAMCTPHTMPSSWTVSLGRSCLLPRGWRPT